MNSFMKCWLPYIVDIELSVETMFENSHLLWETFYQITIIMAKFIVCLCAIHLYDKSVRFIRLCYYPHLIDMETETLKKGKECTQGYLASK